MGRGGEEVGEKKELLLSPKKRKVFDKFPDNFRKKVAKFFVSIIFGEL